MHLIADSISTLGSRLNLIFDPYEHCAYIASYGRFTERPIDLAIGFKSEGKVSCLPFTHNYAHFGQNEQQGTMTSVGFTGTDVGNRLQLNARFRAPFYPKDKKLSTAPFFYIDIELKKTCPLRWGGRENPDLDKGKLFIQISGQGLKTRKEKGRMALEFSSVPFTQRQPEISQTKGVKFTPIPVRHYLLPLTPKARVSEKGITITYDLSEAPSTSLSIIWAAYETKPILAVRENKTKFKYTSFFNNIDGLISYAKREKKAIEKKCFFLDSLIDDWSLGQSYTNLVCLAFHSFLLNTWWTIRKDKTDWFSVWEGSCYYHSTIDVEYNNAMVYFNLWPELLKLLLNEWSGYYRPGEEILGRRGNNTIFFCHDMGSVISAGEQHYHHSMPVEENFNYLLLFLGYACITGDIAMVKKYFDALQKAADFIVNCDTTGNGFPDEGIANTFDDASPAIQYGKEQVYLAVKAYASLKAFTELSGYAGKKTKNYRKWFKALRDTLEKKGWLKDHYVVTTTKTTKGMVDAWTHKPLPAQRLEGWDAYSIYTSNGCLYPFMAGLNLDLNKKRLFTDIDQASRRTMTEFGSRHSSVGKPVVWISQNLWRDYCAAYLGLDMLNNVERYWNYQQQQGDNEEIACFYDTTMQNNLCFYPRGITSLGVIFAAGGIVINRPKKILGINPLRDTLDIPLLPFVDWKRLNAPWLKVRRKAKHRMVEISHKELLGKEIKKMSLNLRVDNEDYRSR